MTNRHIVISDLHGNYVGLSKLLDKANYRSKKDKLIFVGDYNDHWPNMGFSTKILIDILIALKSNALDDVHFVIGNHDKWFLDYLYTGEQPAIWMQQGGEETLLSYFVQGESQQKIVIPDEHKIFYETLLQYYVDDVVVVVHGGIPTPEIGAKIINQEILTIKEERDVFWDRQMIFTARTEFCEYYKTLLNDRYLIAGHTAHMGPFINDTNPKWLMIDTDFRGAGLAAAIIENGKSQIITV